MRVIDEPLLASFRRPGRCEWCGVAVPMLCAAHIFGRGAGRVDIRCNLVAMGMDAIRDCVCHHDSHLRGWPGRDELLAVAAAREGVMQTDIEAVVWMVRRLPKSPSRRDLDREVSGLSPAQRKLAHRELGGRLAELVA